MIEELKEHDITMYSCISQAHCKVSKNSSCALDHTYLPKVRHRTKHVSNNYHCFGSYVRHTLNFLHAESSENQLAGMFTTPTQQNMCLVLSNICTGW